MNPQDRIYNGVLRSSAFQPAIFGGTYNPKLFQPGDEQKTVILHFHGGSFLCGAGRQGDCKFAAATIMKRIHATALFVQYRLASDPAGTFPAAIQDALTVYKHLLDMNIPASKIVISSGFADGNSLPSPPVALLWSPSIDLATQCNPNSIDLLRNNKTDYITGFTLVR